ncbi:energy-coupling factor ABC transporter permease [Curvibacter sp. CHRR-16]|uniref:energy-coupling factor ABC transporter permease n=1 Tax=Curvibacter sp. CHRR-16 TaxID=2835872 RepID=UPI001BDA18B2|nr:energy-coupling factor ABC transporter permease [Curvibacter sp. CHRR-16]MBT0571326.1 energy-coupling factor ABC transporter permease [Curvibacter sp. CHRR-16]
MHIEIGILTDDKLLYAGVAATALVAAHLPTVVRKPANLLRTALAAFFFSLLMQAWHLPIGPSELHMVGAMPIYLLFGFVPTLLGFGVGLFLQAALFEPQDMLHLAVNFLSLAVPLMAVHHTLGQRLQQLSVRKVLQLDGVYYTGVTLMVGFWLSISTETTAFAQWAAFAASYISLVLLEPVLTMGIVALGSRMQGKAPRLLQWALDEAWLKRTAVTA